MLIRTKFFNISHQKYFKKAIEARFVEDGPWIGTLLTIFLVIAIAINSYGYAIFSFILAGGYFAFWMLQFYGIRFLDQAKFFFLPTQYEISGKNLQLKTKSSMGVEIPWRTVRNCIKREKYFLLVITKAHIIYLPKSLFQNPSEVNYANYIFDSTIPKFSMVTRSKKNFFFLKKKFTDLLRKVAHNSNHQT